MPDPALQPKPGWQLVNPAGATDDADVLFWGSRLPRNYPKFPLHAVPLDDLIWMYAGKEGPREWRLEVYKEILRQGVVYIPLNGNLSDLASSAEGTIRPSEDRAFPLWKLSPKVLCFLYRSEIGPPGYRAILRLVLGRQGFHVPIEGNLRPRAKPSASWDELLAEMKAEDGELELDIAIASPANADDRHHLASDQAPPLGKYLGNSDGSEHLPSSPAEDTVEQPPILQTSTRDQALGRKGDEPDAAVQQSKAQTTWAVESSDQGKTSGTTDRATAAPKKPAKKKSSAKRGSLKGKAAQPAPDEQDLDELESSQ